MRLTEFFKRKESAQGSIQFLIAGLGNPEKKYENSRHNAGFAAIDELSGRFGIDVGKTERKAVTGTGMIGGQKIMLAKPLTYMNASGEAIRALCDYYKIDSKSALLVIVDDVNLPVGMLRIREKGSAGGHNGLKNIIAHLGHESFARLRIGVGGDQVKGDLIPHVLGSVPKEEREAFAESIVRAADAAALIAEKGVPYAMNLYNRKRQEAD